MDKQNFAERVRQRERTLYRVAMSYLASEDDAADAVQEALLRAWNRRNTLRDEQYFSTWLTRILINECKTMLRRRKRCIPMEQLPQKPAEEPAFGERALRDALFELPESYRVPLVLHVLEGYQLKEIAAMLHLPLGTVKTRIARARKQLKKEGLKDE